jgi:hypothetical protein
MSHKNHASPANGIRERGRKAARKTFITGKSTVQTKPFQFLFCSMFIFCALTFGMPKVCVAPQTVASPIKGGAVDGQNVAATSVAEIEDQVHLVFERFRTPMEPSLIHEMTMVALDNHVDPRLVAAIVVAESSGNPLAISDHNAIGLLQINARVWGQKLDFTRNNPFDPLTNLRLGIPILQRCMKEYGRLDSALAAYVGDPDDVRDGTAVYVKRIIRIFEKASGKKVTRKPAKPVLETSEASSNPGWVQFPMGSPLPPQVGWR